MSVRSGGDKEPSFAHSDAHDAGNPCLFVEVRRVYDGDIDWDRKVAKLIEHADRSVMATANDRHDDEQVDV
jgi:hypothetical protein